MHKSKKALPNVNYGFCFLLSRLARSKPPARTHQSAQAGRLAVSWENATPLAIRGDVEQLRKHFLDEDGNRLLQDSPSDDLAQSLQRALGGWFGTPCVLHLDNDSRLMPFPLSHTRKRTAAQTAARSKLHGILPARMGMPRRGL